MNLKVTINFSLWPYEETMAVSMTPESFQDLDKYVDSLASNIKMRILSHIKTNHPTVWYKNSPLDIDKLNELQNAKSTS